MVPLLHFTLTNILCHTSFQLFSKLKMAGYDLQITTRFPAMKLYEVLLGSTITLTGALKGVKHPLVPLFLLK